MDVEFDILIADEEELTGFKLEDYAALPDKDVEVDMKYTTHLKKGKLLALRKKSKIGEGKFLLISSLYNFLII